MANWFVRSLATGTAAGTSWTNATTTIAAAITLAAAGDTYFIADDHAETSAATITLAFKGSVSVPDTIACVDHTITSPTSADLRSTATVTTTGTTAAIAVRGSMYLYGIKFSCGTSTSAQVLSIQNAASVGQFEACAFILAGTGASNMTVNSGSNAKTRWTNCTVQFGAVGQNINVGPGIFEWVNTSSAITGATIPTSLFVPTSGNILVEGVDLSALVSGNSFMNSASQSGTLTFKDCKLGASVVAVTNQQTIPQQVFMIRCDSGNTNYRNEFHTWHADQTTETTIVRSGGATDGVTGFSGKVVTRTVSLYQYPYDFPPITIWNDTTGTAKTITVEGIASAVPNNDEVWLEVAYLGSSTFPQGSRSSTRKLILGTAAANTTSTATWGGALTGKFKMAVTITPQQKGPITAYVKIGKPSATIYIDPMITVT
jgi:hypothetical protein